MNFLDITEGKDPRLGLATHEFDVNGYSYYTDIEDDDDVRKIWHYAKTPDGDVVDIDFTPYDYMNREIFTAWVEQGMPERKGPGPLRKEDFITSESRETTKTQLVAADIGRILMDKGAKTNDMTLSVLLSRLGDELTRFGEPFAAKNTTDLAKAVGINVAQVIKLIKYGQAILDRDGPIDPRTIGGKSDLDEEMSTTPHDDVEVKNPKTGMTQTVSKAKAKQLIRKGYQVVGVHHNESTMGAPDYNPARGEYSSNREYGMFSDEGNDEVAEIVDDIVRRMGRGEFDSPERAIDAAMRDLTNLADDNESFEEATDTDVRDQVAMDLDKRIGRDSGMDEGIGHLQPLNLARKRASIAKQKDRNWSTDSGWQDYKGQKKDPYGNTIKDKNLSKSMAKAAKKQSAELEETLSPEEKRLVNQMYNKDGTLTPLGKKVMDHGKKQKPVDNKLAKTMGGNPLDKFPSIRNESITEAQFDEAAGEKDACYRKVKSRYKVWPSAYASGALVKCRKVGASNWGNKSKK